MREYRSIVCIIFTGLDAHGYFVFSMWCLLFTLSSYICYAIFNGQSELKEIHSGDKYTSVRNFLLIFADLKCFCILNSFNVKASLFNAARLSSVCQYYSYGDFYFIFILGLDRAFNIIYYY